jgi:hypothetical protein
MDHKKIKIQGLHESTYETHLFKIGPLASKLVQATLHQSKV